MGLFFSVFIFLGFRDLPPFLSLLSLFSGKIEKKGEEKGKESKGTKQPKPEKAEF